MHNICLLVKNYFQLYIGAFNRSGKRKKYIGALGLIAIFGLLGIFLFTNMANLTVDEAIKAGEPRQALFGNAMIAVLFALFLTIFRCVSPNKSNDEELLLSLPFSKREIVTSKIIYNYLFDLCLILVSLLPSYIVYASKVLETGAILFVLRGIVLILLLPCFSNALATFIAIFFQKIAGRFKNFGAIQSILGLLLMILFMFFYYYVNFSMYQQGSETIQKIYNFFVIQDMVKFVADQNGLAILVLGLICIVPFILSILFKSLFLGKSAQKYHSKNHTLVYDTKSVTKALYEKEIKTYFNTPIYVMNTAFGSVLLVLFSVIFNVLGKEFLDNLLSSAGLTSFTKNIPYIVCMLGAFLSITICTTSPSISLEGKRLWILKAHPISSKAVFLSKIAVNMVIAEPSILISSFLVVPLIGWVNFIFYFLLCTISTFVMAVVGLLFNLSYPRFDWESEQEPVKQSFSVLLSMLFGMILVIIPYGLYFILDAYFSPTVYLALLTVFYLIASFVAYKILLVQGSKKYQAL